MESEKKKARYTNRKFGKGSRQQKVDYWRQEISQGQRKGVDRDRAKKKQYIHDYLHKTLLYHGNVTTLNLHQLMIAFKLSNFFKISYNFF